MINNDILAIKDSILNSVGETCEKIFLFGSYAYGIPHEDSDYDFFVVLNDASKNPLVVLQKIYRNLAQTKMLTPVDYWLTTNHVLKSEANFPQWNEKSPAKELFYMKEIELIKEWVRFSNNDLIVAKQQYSKFSNK
ncbi:MAG: nucleotidyltransferase domain-containing protein [Treponema sp.]|jgi:predicted nucleotidyltransferase|nr:nucleotidyltransferase domain-containing protein [Treponema sp.]